MSCGLPRPPQTRQIALRREASLFAAASILILSCIIHREEVEGSEDTGDSTEAADDAGDDDAPLVPLDPEVIVGQRRERTFTDTSELEMTLSQSGMHCNHRERFNLAFNIGLFVSLILLILEGIYAYGEDGVREHIVFYLWAFRVGYYAALLAASVGCTVMFRKLLPHQVLYC